MIIKFKFRIFFIISYIEVNIYTWFYIRRLRFDCAMTCRKLCAKAFQPTYFKIVGTWIWKYAFKNNHVRNTWDAFFEARQVKPIKLVIFNFFALNVPLFCNFKKVSWFAKLISSEVWSFLILFRRAPISHFINKNIWNNKETKIKNI